LSAQAEVLRILDDVLGLKGRARTFSAGTPLLGSVAELDSMAVLSVITALEESFGLSVEDDELNGDTFATVGSLVDFVDRKRGG
jgi:acyl carrier protein